MPDEAAGQAAGTTTTTTADPAGQGAAAAPLAFSWDSVKLSPDMKNLVNDRQWSDIDSALNSYRNLEKLTGVPPEQIIKMPKDNDPKAWGEVYDRLGRPKTSAEYVIPVPEGDKGEFAGVAKAWFHEAGVSQSAATKLAEKWNGFMADSQKKEAASVAEANQIQVNELKSVWGGEYDKNAQLVDKAAEAFGMKHDQLNALKGVMGPKGAMEFLHNIGKRLGVEETNTAGMSNATPGNAHLSPEMAESKRRELMGSKDFVQLFNSPDPKSRAEARDTIANLIKLANPGAGTMPIIQRST